MADNKTVLITGGNRGIGQALVASFLQRPNHTVIAAVRNVKSVPEQPEAVKHAKGSRLVVVKVDSESDSDAANAVKELTSTHGITSIDILVANAGIGDYSGPASSTPADQLRRHFNVNAVAPLLLFQACEPLLKKAAVPKYFIMSSNLASLGLMEYIPFPGTAYGASKCASNFVTRKLHFENDWLVAVVIGPGWVQTDMGSYAARISGVSEAPVSLEDSVKGVLQTIDGATRETASGNFIHYDQTPIAW